MSTINPTQLPLHVKVRNFGQCIFFQGQPNTIDNPRIKNGEEIVLTSRPGGMYSFYYFHTLSEVGSGEPSGFVHISAIEAING